MVIGPHHDLTSSYEYAAKFCEQSGKLGLGSFQFYHFFISKVGGGRGWVASGSTRHEAGPLSDDHSAASYCLRFMFFRILLLCSKSPFITHEAICDGLPSECLPRMAYYFSKVDCSCAIMANQSLCCLGG